MKKTTPTPVSGNRKKVQWHNMFKNVLAVVLFGGIFVWLGMNIYHEETAHPLSGKNHETHPAPGVKLDHSLVCMASNVYMGNAQTQVLSHGKTYSSCGSVCTAEILSSENVRMASDPYSRRTVNKADAFISMSPDSVGKILYFESEENLKRYFKK